MLTAENYAANLKTAARNAAAAAGVTGIAPGDWTIPQRQAYNRELVRVITTYPGSFSAETVNIAASTNTDYGLRGHTFDSALDLGISAAVEGAKSYLKTILAAGAVIAVFYFVFIAALNSPRNRA